jgi:hypothetical protein
MKPGAATFTCATRSLPRGPHRPRAGDREEQAGEGDRRGAVRVVSLLDDEWVRGRDRVAGHRVRIRDVRVGHRHQLPLAHSRGVVPGLEVQREGVVLHDGEAAVIERERLVNGHRLACRAGGVGGGARHDQRRHERDGQQDESSSCTGAYGLPRSVAVRSRARGPVQCLRRAMARTRTGDPCTTHSRPLHYECEPDQRTHSWSMSGPQIGWSA